MTAQELKYLKNINDTIDVILSLCEHIDNLDDADFLAKSIECWALILQSDVMKYREYLENASNEE